MGGRCYSATLLGLLPLFGTLVLACEGDIEISTIFGFHLDLLFKTNICKRAVAIGYRATRERTCSVTRQTKGKMKTHSKWTTVLRKQKDNDTPKNPLSNLCSFDKLVVHSANRYHY